MATLVNPRFILLQSETDKTQYFYLVLFDLPADTDTYKNPSSIVPHLNGTELIYHTEEYALPSNYNGDTITYLLQPFMVISPDESTPNITSIIFKGKNDTEKKGDTGGVVTKQINTIPNNLMQTTNLDSTTDYQCKERCFVIQSDTNTSTYFVGTLVDFPSDLVMVTSPQLVNTNELKIMHNSGTNANKTQLAYSSSPASYDSTTTPKTATYIAIFVDGHNTSADKGILLYVNENENINLYANPWRAEYGS